ncbi:CocE/NonD family hydrolase [Micromonospora sp. WMMC415]|uniref:CocE/NonD family hydrolase n=1 Tax=Micromonospora sp. WMMC415 TaxID=2675222 RepID=UPI0012B4F28A|nr:CocE/NonD family hydrolase [Micromonospora sp. WMMC415]QGN49202.1 CocE/NonD family hydrolase [Micromonospora sp. WMMC415]
MARARRIKTHFDRPVDVIDHVWISMRDGVRLSARVWLPVDASSDPVPAILEYIPYRKGDGTVVRDSQMHPYFAGHGYAAVRVDMRGSGESEGVLLDEYLAQEQDDALEVLGWLAEQPWCTGRVGIIGKSWGGFNGLQIAAHRPAELGAIITVCSTDDRYADDVHYLGGTVLASKMLPWASTMLGFNALPPDPAVAGERWREMWLERLEGSPPFVEAWLTHQRRDDYWKHGSVCEDYSAIECPVYAVGGWADAYSDAIPRLLAGLPGPRKALIGPWGHQYPESGVPGPAIGFLQECLRWWDHWLKGVDTGIMDEPMLRAWMQEPVPPRPAYDVRPGRWVAEPSWPRTDDQRLAYMLDAGALVDHPVAERRLEIDGTQLVGLDAGDWCPAGGAADLPLDQRAEDARSLCFDTKPLADRIEIFGFPEVTLSLASSRPLATVVVRLCDVAPDGSSLLVTRGVLNLSHADGHEHPRALKPGRRYEVTVSMNAIAQAVPAGHRLRLAVSSSYWPWVWPPPEQFALSLFTGGSTRLDLPVRTPRPEDGQLAAFGEPETAAPAPVVSNPQDPAGGRVIVRDLATGTVEILRRSEDDTTVTTTGLAKRRSRLETYAITEGDPLSARVSSETTYHLARDGWRIRIEAHSVMTADPENFRVTNTVNAFESDRRVFESTRDFEVPRDHC